MLKLCGVMQSHLTDVIEEQEAERVSCSRCYRRCEVWFEMQSHLRDLLVEQETECVSCGCRL